MLAKKCIHKLKNVIHRRLKNLQSLVSKGYNRSQSTRAPSFSAIPSSNLPKMQHVDNFNRDLLGESLIRHNETVNSKKSDSATRSTSKDLNIHNTIFTSDGGKSVGKTTKEERVKEENRITNERRCLLAEKIKELEIVDAYNTDHAMDIEEALHYYSLITCPVYQDIVDRYFMDMCSEFLLPQPSASINYSTRRLHSMRL